MAHVKYTTPAWVLGRAPSGEGNAAIAVLTRDFGLLFAFARSIREHRSRLRYSVQTGTHIDASLVRGRMEWRLVSAREATPSEINSPEARLHRARLIRLVRRLVRGSERNDRLYEAFEEGIQAATLASSTSECHRLEVLASAKIVDALGYLPRAALSRDALVALAGNFSKESITEAYEKRATLSHAVNAALAASQL